MLFIDSLGTEPYFNLATEEYILKSFDEDIFMLWQNEPSIIIGKNQDVRVEINREFVKQNKLKVVRRFSGGGAVYHDLGNLNLTFIETTNTPNFNKQTLLMQKLLKEVGIDAIADHRHTLTVDGLKISGSAQCIHRTRAMYHATILFDSNLQSLTTALKSKEKPADSKKYVESVRSEVTNIIGFIERPMNLNKFKRIIKDYFHTNINEIKDYVLSNEDKKAIEKIALEKYSTHDWNFHRKTK